MLLAVGCDVAAAIIAFALWLAWDPQTPQAVQRSAGSYMWLCTTGPFLELCWK